MICKPSSFLCLLLGLIVLPDILLAQSESTVKGKAKSVISFIYPADKNTKIHRAKSILETLYDTSGKVISEKVDMIFSEKESMLLSDLIYYDDMGRKVKIIRTSKVNSENKSKHDTLETTYHYNKQGNLEGNYYADKGKKATIRTVYDTVKKTDTIYRDNKYNPVTIVRHLDKFHDEEISFYREVDQFASEVHHLSNIPYAPDTSITPHRSLIIYDSRHNKTHEILFKKNGDRGSHESYIYDDKDNLLKYIDSNRMYTGGAPKNPEKEPFSDSRTYRYKKFDKYGNWQEQYSLLGDKFILITRRKFEYYD